MLRSPNFVLTPTVPIYHGFGSTTDITGGQVLNSLGLTGPNEFHVERDLLPVLLMRFLSLPVVITKFPSDLNRNLFYLHDLCLAYKHGPSGSVPMCTKTPHPPWSEPAACIVLVRT